jgi:hypothetical protein
MSAVGNWVSYHSEYYYYGLRNVTLRSAADKYRRFASTPKLKATISSGTWVPVHQTIWHSFPEICDIYNYEGIYGLHTYTNMYISREKDVELLYLIFNVYIYRTEIIKEKLISFYFYTIHSFSDPRPFMLTAIFVVFLSHSRKLLGLIPQIRLWTLSPLLFQLMIQNHLWWRLRILGFRNKLSCVHAVLRK